MTLDIALSSQGMTPLGRPGRHPIRDGARPLLSRKADPPGRNMPDPTKRRSLP